MNSKQHWQDWLVALVGIWLIASYWILGLPVPAGASVTMATWNLMLSGAAALILGIAALAAYRFWEEWVAVALGVWVAASPWILTAASAPEMKWNLVISGLVIVVAAGWNLFEAQSPGMA